MEHYGNEQSILTQIEKNSRRQARLAAVQCIFSFISLACCAAVLMMALSVVPKLNTLADNMVPALKNLETVTEELAGLDFESLTQDMEALLASVNSLVSNADTLIASSQEGLAGALENINAIDFKALNKAIQDLSDVIEPLANFFNGFR